MPVYFLFSVPPFSFQFFPVGQLFYQRRELPPYFFFER